MDRLRRMLFRLSEKLVIVRFSPNWPAVRLFIRSQVEGIAAAPHESQLDGTVYPGTCSDHSTSDAQKFIESGIPFAWRFRISNAAAEFIDVFFGLQKLQCLRQQLGDFVVGRANGAIAYQLAVVIDDHDMHVQQVVRGNDLLYSTFRQLALYSALGWQPPNFCHLPLVVGPDGRRLAKRHGDTRLSFFRERGITAEQVIGYLAFQSGFQSQNLPCRPSELIDDFCLSDLRPAPLVVDNFPFG
jgi:glutamyl-tRNA synthetase